jgi:hypothetical protein
MKPRSAEELRRMGNSVEQLQRALDVVETLCDIYSEFGIGTRWLERCERLKIEIETLRHRVGKERDMDSKFNSVDTGCASAE